MGPDDILRLNLNPTPNLTYEEVLSRWKNAKLPTDIFSGHFLINFVANSSQLEGIDVSYNTTREIFESEKLRNYSGDLRAVFSVVNNKKVASLMNGALMMKEVVTPDLIKRVHAAVMFASIDSHRYEDNGERAGQFKRGDYCVGRCSVGVPPRQVGRILDELCQLCASEVSADPLKLATVFHCYFEHIHPFADGNGRVGRWLTNYILVLHNHPPLLFEADSRQRYFNALEAFDISEEYTEMYQYLKEQTVSSWPAIKYMV